MNDAGTSPPLTWAIRSRSIALCGMPKIMGILNVTPDSFSDGGQYNSTDLAITRAMQMLEEGADILDIGGQSTRPGSDPISDEEEAARVLPVIEHLRGITDVPISVDTFSAKVAQGSLALGADVVNDVSAFTMSEKIADVVAQFGAGAVLMHMQGKPKTMQVSPQYSDVVAEVVEHLKQRIEHAVSRGIKRESLAIDPGIGFGKLLGHNLTLLRDLQAFRSLGLPIVVGHSRKSFIGAMTGAAVQHRDFETVVLSVKLALSCSADIIRVHDVASHKRAFDFLTRLG